VTAGVALSASFETRCWCWWCRCGGCGSSRRGVVSDDGFDIHDPACVSHGDELDKSEDTGDNVDEPLDDLSDWHRVFGGVIKFIADMIDGVCYLLLLGFDDCRVGEFCGSGHSGRLSSVTNVTRIQGARQSGKQILVSVDVNQCIRSLRNQRISLWLHLLIYMSAVLNIELRSKSQSASSDDMITIMSSFRLTAIYVSILNRSNVRVTG
jgi:hypothetical protein